MFEIGSVTKVFTALALARLTVAGLTDLDQPLVELLPPGARVPVRDGMRITLRHLATHTSGLPRLPTGMLRRVLLHRSTRDPYADCTTERLLESLARTRLRATPGRRFSYSNFGAGLLGLALAHRVGTDYAALIAREIAIRLTREVKHQINPFAWVHLGWMGRRLHAKQGGHLQLWHNGGTGGFSSFVGFDPEKSVAVVALSSTQRPVHGPASELLGALQSAARGGS